jgi:hypothetical protein
MAAIDDAADKLVSSIRAAYSDLKDATGLHWYSSSAQEQVHAGVVAIGPMIDTWAGELRKYAENGQRDDGSLYSWDMWTDQAKVLASDIQSQGGYFNDGSSIQAVIDAGAQTIVDAGNKAASALEGVGGFLLSPWTWGIGLTVLGLLFVGPELVPLVKRFAKAVKL